MKVKKDLVKSSLKGANLYFFWVQNVIGPIFVGLVFLAAPFLVSRTDNWWAVFLICYGGAGFLLWFGRRNYLGWKHKRKCWPYDWRVDVHNKDK